MSSRRVVAAGLGADAEFRFSVSPWVSKSGRLMQNVVIQNAVIRDFDAICALNQAEVQHTSAMDVDRLEVLHALACYHKIVRVDGALAAFILAMRDGACYENDNFAWFAHNYPRFVYIDRVVVSAAFKGLRIGSRLYEDLFAYARANEIPVVTCEYNVVPPNDASKAFHEKFGFREQGTQWVAAGTKCVSLQAAGVGLE
jgi:predicted GNAT superfamily acetyltransferase